MGIGGSGSTVSPSVNLKWYADTQHTQDDGSCKIKKKINDTLFTLAFTKATLLDTKNLPGLTLTGDANLGSA